MNSPLDILKNSFSSFLQPAILIPILCVFALGMMLSPKPGTGSKGLKMISIFIVLGILLGFFVVVAYRGGFNWIFK